jgi:hypothetical protein
MREDEELPYVDRHELAIDAPRAIVWDALEGYVRETLGARRFPSLGRVLGTEPASGFAVVRREPSRTLELAGRHRFARYRLRFELDDGANGGTRLVAVTHAEFPGVRGWVYRTLVIGTRLHVLATRGILRAVQRRTSQQVVPSADLGS